MKTIKIKNLVPVIYCDDIDKDKIYLYFKHWKWKLLKEIYFSKKELLNYLKDREKIFNNLFHFLEYKVFKELWIEIKWSLTETDHFIRRFKENYDSYWLVDLI